VDAVSTVTETPFQPWAVDDLLELWRRVMPRDAPGRPRFRDLVLLDPAFRPDGLIMLWRDGRLIGFGYAVAPGPGQGQGWLVALGVAPDERGRGHGTRLLRSCLRFLTAAGCSAAGLGGNGERYLLPGVDPVAYPAVRRLLEREGFCRTGSTSGMACELVVDQSPVTASGRWEYRHPEDGDIPQLLRVVAEISPSWSGLFREYLARAERATHIWIAIADGTIAGFAGSDLFPGCPGRFGPMGVLPAARGEGVGGRLLRLSLGSMAARGHRRAWFLWAPESEPGLRMYASAGFGVHREFEFFSRDLPTAPREGKSDE
jgi:mycothiol synthase